MLKKVLLLSISLGSISNSISMDIPKPSIMSTIVNRSMTYIYGIGTVVLSDYMLKTSISNKYIRYGISSAIGLLTKISSQYILDEMMLNSSENNSMNSLKTSYILGADINAKDKSYDTPLNIASYYGRKDIVEYLVNNGADINAKNISCFRPIDTAIYFEKFDIANYLINKIDIANYKDIYNYTDLQIALIKGDTNLARELISNGHVVNNSFYYTPLHLASAYGYKDIVELLINNVDEINARSGLNKTPLDLAKTEEIKNFLRSNGAKEGKDLN